MRKLVAGGLSTRMTYWHLLARGDPWIELVTAFSNWDRNWMSA
jgi:hypothetical protein